MEIYSYFTKHLGPRSMSAGLGVHFDENLGEPGIHFRATVSSEYQPAIVKGLEDGLAIRFPDSLNTASINIERADEHPFNSSQFAFYLAARCVIEQAYILRLVKPEDLKSQR